MERPDESPSKGDAKFEAKQKAKAAAKKEREEQAQAKFEAKRDAKAAAKRGATRKTGGRRKARPIEVRETGSEDEVPEKRLKPREGDVGGSAGGSEDPDTERARRAEGLQDELREGVRVDAPGSLADVPFRWSSYSEPGVLQVQLDDGLSVFGIGGVPLGVTREKRPARPPHLLRQRPDPRVLELEIESLAEPIRRSLEDGKVLAEGNEGETWWLPASGSTESIISILRALELGLRAVGPPWPVQAIWVQAPAFLSAAAYKEIVAAAGHDDSTITSEVAHAQPPSDNVPVHHDDPAEVDALGRAPYAAALAQHVRQWHGGDGGVPAGGAFMLHLFGPWGAGKSTLLNLLRKELQDEDPAKNPVPWVFIEFNAWKNSHLDPPWWHLLDRVYREIADGDPRFRTGQAPSTPLGVWFMLMRTRVLNWIRDVPLRAWERTGARAGHSWGTSAQTPDEPCWLKSLYTSVASWTRSSRLRVSETLWRLRAGRSWGTLCAITAGVLLGLALIVTPFVLDGDDGGGGIPWVETLSGLVGLGLSVWAVSRGLVGSLIGGSGRAAEAFTLRAHDPMERIRDRFGELVRASGRPVAIVIDDLDRCSAEYVVGLLEGVQTLFRDPPVLFVVAAERRWIATSFETVYPEHSADHDRPGHRLGYRFVEKLFQLSAPVPRLSETMRDRYWDHLLRVEQGEEDVIEEQRLRAERAMQVGDSAQAVKAILDEQLGRSGDDKLPEVVLREAAVKRLSSREVRDSLDHVLRPYARWLEPNPRAMKRLVNMYAVQSVALILEETDFEISKLVRWLQLGSRWPLLVEHLERVPEHVELAGDALDEQISELEGTEDKSAARQVELLRLLRMSDVREMLDTEPALTAEDVRAYGGRKEEDVEVPDAGEPPAAASEPPEA